MGIIYESKKKMVYDTDIEIAFSCQKDIEKEMWFSKEEEQFCLMLPEMKRTSYVLGRIAVKKAASAYFFSSFGMQIPFRDFFVQNSFLGIPKLVVSGKKVPDILLSLSHSGTMAVAAVGAVCYGKFGVDIELLRDWDSRVVMKFLAATEQKIYRNLSGKQQSLFVTQSWSLKEACLKALGTGLCEHPCSVTVGNGMDIPTNKGYELFYLNQLCGVGNILSVPVDMSNGSHFVAVLVHIF